MKKTIFMFLTIPFFFNVGCAKAGGKIITLEGEFYSEIREQFDCRTGKIRYHKDDLNKLGSMRESISESIVPGITSGFTDPSNYYEYMNGIVSQFEEIKSNEISKLCKK